VNLIILRKQFNADAYLKPNVQAKKFSLDPKNLKRLQPLNFSYPNTLKSLKIPQKEKGTNLDHIKCDKRKVKPVMGVKYVVK